MRKGMVQVGVENAMRLRSVIILVSSIGAAAAFLLALDIHRRMDDARHEAVVSNTLPGADSVYNFGEVHLMGLLGLAFLFLAVVLLMLVDTPKVETFVAAAPRGDRQQTLPEPGKAAIGGASDVATAPAGPVIQTADAPLEIPSEPPSTAHLSGEKPPSPGEPVN